MLPLKRICCTIIKCICAIILLFELVKNVKKHVDVDVYIMNISNKQIRRHVINSERTYIPSRSSSSPDKVFQIKVYGIVRDIKVKEDGQWQLLYDFEGNREFQFCKYKNCTCTTNHASADAVIVETMALDWNIAPRPLPQLEGQIWIAYTWEPPPIMHTLPWQRLERQFHLTASYQSTSDIYCPYGSYKLKDPLNRGKSDILDELHSKNKLVAWLVSNCGGQSQRRRYVDELQKHIAVDIYGDCGTLSCPKMKDGQPHWDVCNNILRRSYKFYLAFENSLCLDYVTEKVWSHLGRILPVVMGDANYTHILPPHSFIDVRDFPSAKALADYLYVLDKNSEMYAKYFEWTKDYEASYSNPDVYWACQICEYLHTHTFSNEFLSQPRVSLEDLTNVSHACIPPDEFYAGIL